MTFVPDDRACVSEDDPESRIAKRRISTLTIVKGVLILAGGLVFAILITPMLTDPENMTVWGFALDWRALALAGLIVLIIPGLEYAVLAGLVLSLVKVVPAGEVALTRWVVLLIVALAVVLFRYWLAD